jgi:hypothetical protein
MDRHTVAAVSITGTCFDVLGSLYRAYDLLGCNWGVNSFRFGSDPSLAYDTQGNVFYSFIVVYFSNFRGSGANIDGTELVVARSTDGGQTYPSSALSPSRRARTISMTSP